MVKFFFDLHEGGNVLRDEDGLDLPDGRRAEVKAWHTACDVAKDSAGHGDATVKVLVRDERAAVLTVELNARVSWKD
ncbi:hypothetical protein IC762_22285 [Bradyrhizobium genosp. L]|uniref:DUF6894 family protein n=1 Tax=Bradyrhizobium genosp. L TaxID=83637 RepID=UPI0018A2E31E|nr:hypothetical protein [Bradyrhizobium genosp. L]QPF82480.1 hypothetical protein IC762_22285 [Bradyrhizobium genosp. L]